MCVRAFVGATLVVARNVTPTYIHTAGDHKGRPYIKS